MDSEPGVWGAGADAAPSSGDTPGSEGCGARAPGGASGPASLPGKGDGPASDPKGPASEDGAADEGGSRGGAPCLPGEDHARSYLTECGY